MIVGTYLIWVSYGWWLPNDPRGSMSTNIRNPVIAELTQADRRHRGDAGRG